MFGISSSNTLDGRVYFKGSHEKWKLCWLNARIFKIAELEITFKFNLNGIETIINIFVTWKSLFQIEDIANAFIRIYVTYLIW